MLRFGAVEFIFEARFESTPTQRVPLKTTTIKIITKTTLRPEIRLMLKGTTSNKS